MEALKREGLKQKLPNFGPGDTVKVHIKVVEGESERVQIFDGVIISRKGAGIGETFTVRKISFGVGVERIFPVHSPRVEKIEVIKRGKVRRAKLFYLRDRVGKAARLQEKDSAQKKQSKKIKTEVKADKMTKIAENSATQVKSETKTADINVQQSDAKEVKTETVTETKTETK